MHYTAKQEIHSFIQQQMLLLSITFRQWIEQMLSFSSLEKQEDASQHHSLSLCKVQLKRNQNVKD